MNTLIVPDSHGNPERILNMANRAGAVGHYEWSPDGFLFERNPDWRIIHLGDLANMSPHGQEYRGFVSQDHDALKLARDGLFDDLLAGNHETYFTHNLSSGRWYGMAQHPRELHPETIPLMGRLVQWQGQYKGATTAKAGGQTYLISHAGVAPHFQKDLSQDPFEASEQINERLTNRALHVMDYDDLIDSVGRDSGGSGPGGLFWLRPSEKNWTPRETKWPQIVGHTPNFEDHPRWVNTRRMWYVDNGGYMKKKPDQLAGLVSYNGGEWDRV